MSKRTAHITSKLSILAENWFAGGTFEERVEAEILEITRIPEAHVKKEKW